MQNLKVYAQQFCGKIEIYTCFPGKYPIKNVRQPHPTLLLKCRMSDSDIHGFQRVQVTYKVISSSKLTFKIST